MYLFALFQHDPHLTPELHTELMILICKFRPSALMEFLKRSVYFELDRALALCETMQLLEEQVYVLGRIGNHKKALEIMMKKMDNIDMVRQIANHVLPSLRTNTH
jgi:hypothetical protein